MAENEALAALLAEHRYRYPEWRDGEWFVRCSCDADLWIPTSDGKDHEAHRAHVADVLLASDWLAGVKAEVWKECIEAFAWALNNGPRPFEYVRDHNPYRRTTEDTET